MKNTKLIYFNAVRIQEIWGGNKIVIAVIFVLTYGAYCSTQIKRIFV